MTDKPPTYPAALAPRVYSDEMPVADIVTMSRDAFMLKYLERWSDHLLESWKEVEQWGSALVPSNPGLDLVVDDGPILVTPERRATTSASRPTIEIPEGW